MVSVLVKVCLYTYAFKGLDLFQKLLMIVFMLPVKSVSYGFGEVSKKH